MIAHPVRDKVTEAKMIEREAVDIITDLIGPYQARSGTNCRVVEDHLRQFLRNAFALAHPTASVEGDSCASLKFPDNTYTPYGRRSVRNLAEALGIVEQQPTVVSVINKAYEEIAFLRALSSPAQPQRASGEVERAVEELRQAASRIATRSFVAWADLDRHARNIRAVLGALKGERHGE